MLLPCSVHSVFVSKKISECLLWHLYVTLSKSALKQMHGLKQKQNPVELLWRRKLVYDGLHSIAFRIGILSGMLFLDTCIIGSRGFFKTIYAHFGVLDVLRASKKE